MKTAKPVATIVVVLALVLTAAWLGPHGCSSFSAWVLAVLGYNAWMAWIILGCVLALFYKPIYDLVAFGFYRLGLEDRFEGVEMHPEPTPNETSVPPMTMKHKLVYVYPLSVVVGLGLAVAWFGAMRCW